MTPAGWLALALVAAGVLFTLVAVVGLYRLPDVYARAHATSKSDTLGAILVLLGVAVAFGEVGPAIKVGLLVVFLLTTGPTAAHAIVRSAHDQGVEPWTRTDDGARSRPRSRGDGE